MHPPLPVTQGGSIDRLRDGSEGTALAMNIVLGGLVFLLLLITPVGWIMLMLAFATWFAGFALAARLKANGLKVTPTHFPALHAAVERCRERLGRPDLEVYVVQDSTFNAFASRMAFRNFVVLHSGAVDAVLRKGDADQLEFLIGHEIGHVALGHLSFVRGGLAELGLILPPLYFWYRRCQERSADRCGLWACGSRAKAVRGLATLAGGAELGPEVSLTEVQAQWSAISGEFWVTYTRFYSPYPHLIERMVLVDRAGAELGVG